MNSLLLLLIAAGLAAPVWANTIDDDLPKLAAARGCMACHHMDPGATGVKGQPPLAPAWRDIAAQYKSVKGAQQQLTATVMTGSSADANRSTPYQNHWTGKVSGSFMPSHRVAISEADAAKLVAWILAMEPARPGL